MTISSKLYNQQAVSQFNRLTEDAQKLQSQVASGKAFTESADAPTQAVKLSATKVLRAAAQRFRITLPPPKAGWLWQNRPWAPA